MTENAQLQRAISLIHSGRDINETDSDGRSALHFAVQHGDCQAVERLIQAAADVDLQTSVGIRPLHIAVQRDQLQLAELLLRAQADPNLLTGDGQTAIQMAIRAGSDAMLRLLLEAGADANSPTLGEPPLFAAVCLGRADAARLLVSAGGADISVRSQIVSIATAQTLQAGEAKRLNEGLPMPAVLAAASLGQREILIDLLASGADCGVRDGKGATILHHAASKDKKILATVLLIHSEIDSRNKNGNSALHYASLEGVLDTVRKLIKGNAKIDSLNIFNSTPLLMAAHEGHLEVVRKLVDCGASIDLQNKYGCSPLNSAAKNGHLKVVCKLVDCGASIDLQDNYGWSPLNSAADKGHLDVVAKMIDCGASIDLQNNGGWSPLNSAAESGRLKVVGKLIDSGASIDLQQKNGASPLYISALNRHLDVVIKLIDCGANIDLQQMGGASPLYVSAHSRYLDVVTKLIDCGANIDLQNNNGWSPLIHTADKGYFEVTAKLIDCGASIDLKNNIGWSPLDRAAKNGHLDVVTKLIDSGANIDLQDNEGWSPLNRATDKGYLDVVAKMIDCGASIDLKSNNGWLPLNHAADKGLFEVVTKLIDCGANIDLQDDDGWSPLNRATFKGHTEVVAKLINCGASIDLQNNDGCSPLNRAADEGNLKVVTTLIDCGATIDLQDNDGWSPLNRAAISGHVDVVGKLIDSGASIDLQNNNGWTPLSNAVGKGYFEMVSKLIDFGANIDLQDNEGWSPLNRAAEKGYFDIIIMLLDSGASIDLQNSNGCAPLNTAVGKGHFEVAAKLIHYGANINLQQRDGASPVYISAQNRCLDAVAMLIQRGANINLRNNEGWSPLSSAVKNGHLEVVGKLIEFGAAIDPQLRDDDAFQTYARLSSSQFDKFRFSPVHLAVEFDHSEVLRVLIKAGADVNALGNTGLTPIHLASWSSRIPIAVLLLDSAADPRIRNEDGLSATDILAICDSPALISVFEQFGTDKEASVFSASKLCCEPSYSERSSLQVVSLSVQFLEHLHLLCCFGNANVVPSRCYKIADISENSCPARLDALTLPSHFNQSEYSMQLHESLISSGFTRNNAAVQSGTAAALEKILRLRLGGECYFTGSFADGWGNCLSGICGQTDADSDIDVTVFEDGVKLHLEGTGEHYDWEGLVSCHNVELRDGHVRHRFDASKPNVATEGMTLRPSVDVVRATPCCRYPNFELLSDGYKSCILKDALRAIQYSTDCHVVAAAPLGQEGQYMRVSTTLMERMLMHSLTTLQGQLFIMLKYLIKRVIANRVKGLKTYHAKNVLFFMLDRTPADEWQPQNLIKLLRQSLQLLLDSLTDSNSSEQQCMQHFFMRDAAIYLRKDHERKTKIEEVVRQVVDELPQLMSHFEQTLMKNSPNMIEFHPFLILPILNELRIPESDTEFEYHQIYDAVRRALEMLGEQIPVSDEESHLQQLGSLLSRIPDCARTARESLRAITELRKGRSFEAVSKSLFISANPNNGIVCPEKDEDTFFRINFVNKDSFKAEPVSIVYTFLTKRCDFVWKRLLETDLAWKFMFDFARKPDLSFLPDHLRMAFPWQVPHRSTNSVFINFRALIKSLQLEARKLSGDEAGVESLLGDFGSSRLDTQELLMILHYCNDEATLVEVIHGNRQLIVDTGLVGFVLRFLDARPALRQRCVRETWEKVEDLISQGQFSSAEERQRVELVLRRVRKFLREKEGIDPGDSHLSQTLKAGHWIGYQVIVCWVRGLTAMRRHSDFFLSFVHRMFCPFCTGDWLPLSDVSNSEDSP